MREEDCMNAARRVSEREGASQMARINTDGKNGACLLADCLSGMDDLAKRDWRRKIKTRASSLAGGLFFRRPIRPATASKPPLYPCPSVFSVVHFSPPATQHLFVAEL